MIKQEGEDSTLVESDGSLEVLDVSEEAVDETDDKHKEEKPQKARQWLSSIMIIGDAEENLINDLLTRGVCVNRPLVNKDNKRPVFIK